MLESLRFFSLALMTTCGLTKPVFFLTWRAMPTVKRKWERELTLLIRKVSFVTNLILLLLSVSDQINIFSSVNKTGVKIDV